MVTIKAADGSWSAEGYGESGLPPKKPGGLGCYHADVKDCEMLFDAFCSAVAEGGLKTAVSSNASSNPFEGLAGYFHLPQNCDKESVGDTRDVFMALLRLIDSFAGGDEAKQFLAGRSGLEAAVFGCWSSICNAPFFVFAGITPPSAAPTRSFYTAALNDDINEMVASAQFGLQFTPCLKIKLDGDVEKSRRILDRCAADALGLVWSIDANSAWDVDVAMAHLPVIRHAAEVHGVYMVEQPFPLSYRPGVDHYLDAQWAAFRKELNSIENNAKLGGGRVLLYADESISNSLDVEAFASAVDGVNIKLEKAGGLRGSMRAVLAARRHGLKVWIGTMVSSCLGCTASAHVAYMADDSDVDGGLLVFPDHFTGGFDWRKDDGAILLAGLAAAQSGDPFSNEEWWGFGVKRARSVE